MVQFGGNRKVAYQLAVDFISGADLDFVKITQNIQTGQCNAGCALNAAAVTRCNTVVPADIAGAAGFCAVFACIAATVTQCFGFFAFQSTGESTCANGAGIGLCDCGNRFDTGGRNADTDTAEAGQCVRRGREGIDTEIRITHRTELAFQQDFLSVFQCLLYKSLRVAHKGRDLLTPDHQLVEQFLRLQQRLVIQMFKEHIFQRADLVQPLAEQLLVKKFVQLNADLHIFIRIERRNAGAGRTIGIAGQTLFLISILQNVIRHEQLHTIGDHNVGLGNAALSQLIQFGQKGLRVKCDTVSDNICNVGEEYAGGKKMQCKFSGIVDDGVTGICAALETDDNIRRFRQHIGDFAFPFVAPVGADNCVYHEMPPSAGFCNPEDLPYPAQILFCIIQESAGFRKVGKGGKPEFSVFTFT